jgi:UDP-3-O-[3-hydroxymyristoyl] glucosamine N-acyltransferase
MSITNPSNFLVSDIYAQQAVIRDAPFLSLDEAASPYPQSLTFCETFHFLQIAIKNSNITAIITTPALSKENITKGLVVSENPKISFFELYNSWYEQGIGQPEMHWGIGVGCQIHPTAVISPRAQIGNNVRIGAHTVVEDFVRIADDVTIGPNVVIGAEGLLPIRKNNGGMLLPKPAGGVDIGRGVTVLAGAVIAKSLYRTFTRIGDYSQVGIMANVGHGVTTGEYCVISSNVVIAGHTRLGNRVWISASSSVAHGLAIGDDVEIKMGSVVVRDVEAKAVMSGNFAIPHRKHVMQHLKE